MCHNCNDTENISHASIADSEVQEAEQQVLEIRTCNSCSVDLEDEQEELCDNCSFNCSHCEKTLSIEKLHSGSDSLCENCYENDYCHCVECSRLVEINDRICVNSGDSYCESCHLDNFGSCHECDCEICYSNSSYANIGDNTYCEDCHYYCEICECNVRGCDWDSDHGRCHDCVDEMHSDDYDDYDDDDDSPSWREYGEPKITSSDKLFDYGYHPDIKIYSSLKDKQTETALFGIELEHSYSSNNELRGNALRPTFYSFSSKEKSLPIYYKRDSSINEGGELVTQPFSEESFDYAQWQKYLTWLVEEQKSEAFAVRCNCGIHVHISWRNKNGLLRHTDPFIIAKAMVFQKLFRQNLFKISRRVEPSFNRYANIKVHDSSIPLAFDDLRGTKNFIANKKSFRTSDRFSAFNFKEQTLEIRLFRSTLNYTSFKAIMQLCFNIPLFLETMSLSSLLHHAQKGTLSVFWNESFMSCMPKNVQKYIIKQLKKGE